MTPKYLGISAFAEYTNLKIGTIQGYFFKGMLPDPEIYYVTGRGNRPGWLVSTVEHWMNNRPGRGRTYASMKRHTSNNSTKENN